MPTNPNLWMLNLQFSTSAAAISAGRFKAPPVTPPVPPRPYFNYSQVWLKYNKSTSPLPGWAMDELSPVNNDQIVDADWDWCSTSDATLNAKVDDFMLVRLAPDFDPNGGTLRCAVVFGRGRQGPLPQHPSSRQSPLSDASYNAIPLVDTASTDFTSWPPRRGGVGVPWIWCVGKFYDDPSVDPGVGAHYSFNLGANYKPVVGNYLTYGHDPTVIVTGGGHR